MVVDVKEKLAVHVGEIVTSAVAVKLLAEESLIEGEAEVDNVPEVVGDVDESTETEIAGDCETYEVNEADTDGVIVCVEDGLAVTDDDERGLSVAVDVRDGSRDGAVVTRLDTEGDPVERGDALGLPLVDALIVMEDSADSDTKPEPVGNPVALLTGETVPVFVDHALLDTDTLAVLVALTKGDFDTLAH